MTKTSQIKACAKRKSKEAYMLGVKADHKDNYWDYNWEERVCINQYSNSYELGKKHTRQKKVYAVRMRIHSFLIAAFVCIYVASVILKGT